MEDPIQSALKEEGAGEQFATAENEGNKPVEYYCGIGQCRPKFLQCLRNTKFLTFLLCCDCLLEGALVSGKCMQYLAPVRARVHHDKSS